MTEETLKRSFIDVCRIVEKEQCNEKGKIKVKIMRAILDNIKIAHLKLSVIYNVVWSETN